MRPDQCRTWDLGGQTEVVVPPITRAEAAEPNQGNLDVIQTIFIIHWEICRPRHHNDRLGY